jgi:4-amino-4-deoxy-L-arabinose transferase-like glycosyltransferase
MHESASDNLAALRAALASQGRGRGSGVGLVLLCLLVYLPGLFALPPVDRDEARFAQASRQMFESVAFPAAQRDPALHGGGLVIPMVQNRPRLNKPPLTYWAQSAAAAVLSGGNPYRDSIWMYRIPSLIAAIVAVLLTRRLGTLMFDSGAGNLAGAFLAVCPVIAWEARQARADMVLLAWTVLAMLQLWRVFSRDLSPYLGEAGKDVVAQDVRAPGGLKTATIFWVAIGGGIMTKGPVTPLIAGLTAIALSIGSRRRRWLLGLKPLLALPILALMVGPWVYAVGKHFGFDIYWDTVYRETIGRSTEAREGHWGPPGYHLVLMPLLLWPGSVLTGLGFVVALRLGWRNAQRNAIPTSSDDSAKSRFHQMMASEIGHPSYLFLIAWIVPGWLLFELISTKLPHYTMPMYPALAILSARAVLAAEAKALPGVEARLTRAGFILWLALGALIVFGSLGAVVMRLVVAPGSFASIIGVIVVGLIGALFMLQCLGTAWRGVLARRFARASVSGVIVMVVMWLVVPTTAIPRLMGLSTEIGRELSRIDPGAARPVAAVGYHEDSLVYLTRGRLARLDHAAAIPEWFRQHPHGILVRERESTIQDGPALKEIGAAAGINYSKGRAQQIAIEELAP